MSITISRHAQERAQQRKVSALRYTPDWNVVKAVAEKRGIANGKFTINEWTYVVVDAVIVTTYRKGYSD